MIPFTATAAIAAPVQDAKANSVRACTAASFQGITNMANRLMHMIVAPIAYHAFRVNEESTKGAHMNSNVKARLVAATIAATCRTETPALTRLFARARPTTPIGHAVAECKKKKVKGGACFATVARCGRKNRKHQRCHNTARKNSARPDRVA
jgi:hypothetical protein